MRFIFCIIGVLLYSGLSAQQMSVLSTDSNYNIVRELQEVVVTAEKRELNPGDIPTALTVITPRSIPGENNPDLRNIGVYIDQTVDTITPVQGRLRSAQHFDLPDVV